MHNSLTQGRLNVLKFSTLQPALLGDMNFFRPGAEPIVDVMHAFFRLLDSITKVLLKAIKAFVQSCRWKWFNGREDYKSHTLFVSICLALGLRWGGAAEQRYFGN